MSSARVDVEAPSAWLRDIKEQSGPLMRGASKAETIDSSRSRSAMPRPSPQLDRSAAPTTKKKRAHPERAAAG